MVEEQTLRRSHAFFDDTTRETSPQVPDMFRGSSGRPTPQEVRLLEQHLTPCDQRGPRASAANVLDAIAKLLIDPEDFLRDNSAIPNSPEARVSMPRHTQASKPRSDGHCRKHDRASLAIPRR